MPQVTVDQAMQIALRHHQSGQLQQAEAIYRHVLSRVPEHAPALHLLGLIAHQVKRHDIAIDLIRRVVALEPNQAGAYVNLGNALQDSGQLDAAIDAYRRAVALQPDCAEAYGNLGNALKNSGLTDEAIASYRRAMALGPELPEVLYNFGLALQDKGEIDQAIAAYRRAIALRPAFAQAHGNLGNALVSQRLLDEAIACFRQAVAVDPTWPEGHNNLGNALKDRGELDEAIAALRKAIALNPNLTEAHSNLAFTLQLHGSYDAASIAAELRRWNEQHARPLHRLHQPHSNDPDPDRRLRVGYVSADFREHVVGRNVLPLFREHSREDFEVFCYSYVAMPDPLTAQFRSYSDGWRSIVGFSDDRVAQLVREDRIDILVDLALHTARKGLLVFARKPAPVQVTFAGYPGSTGLDAIDYRLTDPYLDPLDAAQGGPFDAARNDEIYSERSIRLPDSFWCYDPPVMTAGTELGPDAGPLPALPAGHVTFGCLNSFCKVNDDMLELWARILTSSAGSRLMLMTPQGIARERALEVLGRRGIGPERIEFVAHSPIEQHLRRYRRVDIGLDTLPYNGHTTSLDALWMGVPVVTLVGKTVVGRAGLSQLTNLKLTELVAWSPEQYCRIAADLAGDLPRLSALRAGLRQRMRESPLTDAPRFARNIEAAYRDMWRRWCKNVGPSTKDR